VAHHGDVAEVEPVEQGFAEPVDVALVGVQEAIRWLVGLAEADEVDGHAAVPGCHQRWDGVAVQVAPRRVAVHQQDRLAGRLRRIARALVDVVHSQSGAPVVARLDFDVVRRERVVDQIVESRVGRAQDPR